MSKCLYRKVKNLYETDTEVLIPIQENTENEKYQTAFLHSEKAFQKTPPPISHKLNHLWFRAFDNEIKYSADEFPFPMNVGSQTGIIGFLTYPKPLGCPVTIVMTTTIDDLS